MICLSLYPIPHLLNFSWHELSGNAHIQNMRLSLALCIPNSTRFEPTKGLVVYIYHISLCLLWFHHNFEISIFNNWYLIYKTKVYPHKFLMLGESCNLQILGEWHCATRTEISKKVFIFFDFRIFKKRNVKREIKDFLSIRWKLQSYFNRTK